MSDAVCDDGVRPILHVGWKEFSQLLDADAIEVALLFLVLVVGQSVQNSLRHTLLFPLCVPLDAVNGVSLLDAYEEL